MKKFKIVKIVFISWLSAILLVCAPQTKLTAQQVTGKYSVNYPNGSLKEKGFYKQGVKHKTWYYYNEAGLMERREKWKNGVMVWQVFYNAKGKVIKTIDQNGKEFIPPPCNCT